MRTPSSLLFLALLAPWADAQSYTPPQRRQGLASGLALGLSLGDAPGITDHVRVKAPLVQSTVPPAFDPTAFPHAPDYRVAEMFDGWLTNVAGFPIELLDLDAVSTGADLIPFPDGNGTPDLSQTWLAVTVSVDAGTQGAAGSLIEARRLAGKNTASDLVTYYFDGGVGLDPALQGQVLLEQRAEHLALGSEELDGLDFSLGVASHLQPLSPPLFFPRTAEFYFSLHPDAVVPINLATASSSVSFAFDGGGSGLPEVHAGSIYRVSWDSGTGAWSQPELYRSYSELGLAAQDDLDALSVDAGRGTIVFSSDLASSTAGGWSQLRIYTPDDGTGSPAVMDLQDGPDTRVADELGVGNDETGNVDAVCDWDPEPGQVFFDFGVPVPPFVMVEPMGLSMTRSSGAPGAVPLPGQYGTDQVRLQATGWGGLTGEPAGTVDFWFSILDGTTNPGQWTPPALLASVPRSAGQAVVQTSFPYPAGCSSCSQYRVWAIHQGAGGMAASWIVAFR